MGEKGFDFGRPHFLWMAFAVEQDKAANLIDVSLFGADAVMLETDFVVNPIQQLRRLTLRNLRDTLVACKGNVIFIWHWHIKINLFCNRNIHLKGVK